MSPEEKNVIGGIFERLKGAATTQRDAEAEKFIADQIKLQPYAPYVMAQSIYAQEQALTGQQQQIEQLQARLQQLEQYAQQVQQQSQGGGGFLGGLFGGGARQAPPPPMPMSPGNMRGPTGGPMGSQSHGQGQPMQAPGPWGQQPGGPGFGGQQPGPWGQQQPQRGGMGFLGTAAMTAAGVAGGMLAANALTSMFSGTSGAKPATADAGAGATPDVPGAQQQPASYEEPGSGNYAQDASYDDGSYDDGGGDDWA